MLLENPGDELYFGEVYRHVLQEAWLPEGAEDWMRVGKSRRGYRPTQRGLGAQSPIPSQATVRRCFSLCAQNWRHLPLEYPADHPCFGIPDRKWWWQQKEEKGFMCSYYDHYMRYCLYYCLKISCPPEDIVCWAWDPDSTKETIHGYWAGIYVLGGFPPYEWSVDDPDFWIRAVITSIPENGITTRKDLCGIAHIKVTDFCGRTVNGVVTTPDVPWPYLPPTWPDVNPDEIVPDTWEPIYIQDGVPPFTWSVSGTGFSLSFNETSDRNNTLAADPSACGSAKINVSDCLGTNVTGFVRSTAGQWVFQGDYCGLGGIGTQIGTAGPGEQCISRFYFELILGNKKQLQTRCHTKWALGSCPADCAAVAGAVCGESSANCIDPDSSLYPCEPIEGPPASYNCFCAKNLHFYLWEC